MKAIQILINAKDNASKVFDSLQAKVATVGAAILGYFGIQAFVGLVKDAGEFEAAMDRVQAATGASAEEMRGLEAAVKDAASAGFTNTETAAALENIAKAGVDAQEAVGGLPGVMNLAKAGDIELAQSAEYLTKIVAAMGEKFGEAGRYADVLAKGANASNTSVTGLAQALSYSAPAAKALNLSLEYTVGLLGKFADNGIDASRSGTALNSILSQFLDPASKFRNELALAGITTNNFEEALKQLAVAGPRGANAILAVGMEAGPALRGLLNTGIGALDDLVGKLKNAEGSAAATAKTLSGNLNGSLKSLSNAWQSVKDVLGAPVLPVLKQGVDELTAAFRRAVEDGTVQRFGESIAAAMRQGIQFVREFMATVDFTVVIARMQAFADESNATLTKVGEFATNAGNVVKLAWGVMTAGIDGAMAIIYKTTEIMVAQFARIQLGAAALIEALSKITFGELSERYKRAADEIRLSAEATAAASQALGEKAKQALEDSAKGAELAREGWAGVTAAVSDAKDATDTWALAVANAAAEIERAGKVQAEATVKAQAAKKAAEDQAAAVSAAKDALAELREEYEAAVRDGNWQKAAELQEKLNQALRGMKGSAQDAADAVALVDAAFGRLGVTSTAKLKQMAETAKGDFETIRNSGTATAEDLSRAFKVAAEAAIAANKGIAPSWVIAEAGVRGYKIAVDEAGRSTLEAANKGAEGLGRLARGWYETREAIQAHEDAMDRILMKHKLSADYTERQIALLEREAAAAEKAAEAYRKKWNMDKEGYSLNTAGERINQGETQEQIDEDVKRRYGEENVNNPDAQRARQLAVLLSMMSQLGGQVRDPATSKQIADMRRELQELEAALLNGIGAKPKDPAGTGGASGGRGGSSSNDNEDDIPFEVGDTIALDIEGGRLRWRRDGGAWTEGDLYGPALDLGDGLLLEGAAGAAPSFVAGDTWQFRAVATFGTDRMRQPRVGRAFAWDGADVTVSLDLGAAFPVEAVMLALHDIAPGATVELEGGTAAHGEWSMPVDVRKGIMLAVLDPAHAASVRYLRLLITDAGAGGSIGWMWAGTGWQPTVTPNITRSRAWALSRGTGLNAGALYRGAGTAGNWSWDLDGEQSALFDSALTGLMEVLDHSAREGVEALAMVPDLLAPADAALCTVEGDEISDIRDRGAWQSTAKRWVSISLPLSAVMV